ncbi:MAG TPA: hypothetical protein VKY92_12895, partial [Verrucomicrobiae bacterium]|nr:hypothetical protein [Verrucomicrobiae bacterium]
MQTPRTGARRRCSWLLATLLAAGVVLGICPKARAGFVYQTSAEFLVSGDFNRDGIPDVLVLDRTTGNARVGYGDASGGLTWSQPMATGVENATGCAVGIFLTSLQDAVAVTAPGLNRVNLVDLSRTNSAPPPVVVTPSGIGPHSLVALANAKGGLLPSYNWLVVASSDNGNSAEQLDLLQIVAGTATPKGNSPENGPFDHPNALQLDSLPQSPTFAVGLVRGVTDLLDVWQFTNSPAPFLTLSNLPPGSDYTFGRFTGEVLPRFILYQPGGSNLTIVPLIQNAGGYAFGAPVPVSVGEGIQRVFYLDTGTDGSAIIQFGDGVQGLRLPSGVPTLSPVYNSGAGAAGNQFTGVVPLGNGNLALLDSPPGSPTSAHEQVVNFNGTSFTHRTSGNLPAISSRGTRANVWLFQAEPFVNPEPGFIASINAPDWSDSASGLPGSLAVMTETDGGSSSGLGNAATSNLGAPPSGAAFALPDQYRDVISLFSYNSPRPAEPVAITIAPPPGIYDGPIQISFSTLNASDKVLYRLGTPDSWHTYTAAFQLTNDVTIEYYGINSGGARSRLELAAYSLGRNGQPTPTLNLGTGGITTNPPVPIISNTNTLQLSSVGTLFYDRIANVTNGSIWAINLDGSDETFITSGLHPRVSADGRYMAFLRGAKPLVTEEDVWVRDLHSGAEFMLFSNSNFTIGYSWDLTGTNLIFDWSCWLWRIGLTGPASMLPLTTDCYDDAPFVNPVDSSLAFNNLNSAAGVSGLYVTSTNLNSKQQLNLAVPFPSWPAWSPDGKWLVFADGNNNNTAFSPDSGTNLWIVRGDGSGLNQITSLNDGSNGFPHGALWSPSGTALVGAGSIFGTNGLWIIQLKPDLSDCLGAPILL